MANQVTVNNTTNTVSVNQSDRTVTIVEPNTTSVIVSSGPLGPKGDQGEPFDTTEKRILIDTAGPSGSTLIGSPPLYDGVGLLAFGRNALNSYVDTGTGFDSSVAVGHNALSHSIVSPNDALGNAALRDLGKDPDINSDPNNIFTPAYNVGIGQNAGTKWQGYTGTWIGQYSGPFYHNAYGNYNIGIGPLTMINMSSSADDINQRSTGNTGIGGQSLYVFKYGNYNTAVGYRSFLSFQTGTDNTGIGPESFRVLTGGRFNVAIGSSAARTLTTGSSNVIIGTQANGFTSGSNNTIIGSLNNLGLGNFDNNIIFTNGNSIGYRYDGTDTTIYSPVITSGSLDVSGSATINDVLTLTPQDPLPTGAATGSFAVSSSVPPKPYFFDGTNWNALY